METFSLSAGPLILALDWCSPPHVKYSGSDMRRRLGCTGEARDYNHALYKGSAIMPIPRLGELNRGASGAITKLSLLAAC